MNWYKYPMNDKRAESNQPNVSWTMNKSIQMIEMYHDSNENDESKFLYSSMF